MSDGNPLWTWTSTNTSALLGKVKQSARKLFDDARGSHAWDHTVRVFRLCEHIGTVEGVDMEALLRPRK